MYLIFHSHKEYGLNFKPNVLRWTAHKIKYKTSQVFSPPPPPHQLPHMPHISECLMKRSLKPTDLRDMTLGQLQVIVNDLHSQIESKSNAYKLADLCFHRNEQESKQGKYMHIHSDPLALLSRCESNLTIY